MRLNLRTILILVCLGCGSPLQAQPPGDRLGISLLPSVAGAQESDPVHFDGQRYRILPRATLQAGITYQYALTRNAHLYCALHVGRRSFTLRQQGFDDNQLQGNTAISITPILYSAEMVLAAGRQFGKWNLRAGLTAQFARFDSFFYVRNTTRSQMNIALNTHRLNYASRNYTGFGLWANVGRSFVTRNGRMLEAGLAYSQSLSVLPTLYLNSLVLGRSYGTEIHARPWCLSVVLTRYFGRVRVSAKKPAQ